MPKPTASARPKRARHAVIDRRLFAVVVFVGASTLACKRQMPGASAPEAMGTASASPGAGDPLAQPEQALANNAEELRALGVVLDDDDFRNETNDASEPANAEPMPQPQRDDDADKDDAPAATRCEALCQLADTACELRTQICDLAQDHIGESRYEAACWRATDQCTRASTACEGCRGSTAGTADGCAPPTPV